MRNPETSQGSVDILFHEGELQPDELQERLEGRATSVSDRLKEWYGGQHSDSIKAQNQRAASFSETCRDLEGLVEEASRLRRDHRRQLQLVTGQNSIRIWDFPKIEGGIYGQHPTSTPPQTVINVETTNYWASGGVLAALNDHPLPEMFYPDPNQLFIGGWRKNQVAAAIVAQTLSEGGGFRFVTIIQPDQDAIQGPVVES